VQVNVCAVALLSCEFMDNFTRGCPSSLSPIQKTLFQVKFPARSKLGWEYFQYSATTEESHHHPTI
jgi:hypothetical protein